jgi:cysteine desulfurase/selenocysteine lyase
MDSISEEVKLRKSVIPLANSGYDVERIRRDFPILHQRVYGKPLVYLDNAATSQKPKAVIDAISRYYTLENANIHRGVHYLSQVATHAYEKARETVRQFINARSVKEVVFTKGTTEGINLVASTLGTGMIKPGDEIIVSNMEHHSNIVPWQILCQVRGAKLKVVPITDSGELDIPAYHDMLSHKTRLVAIVHYSNSLGTINPVKEIISAAHEQGVWVLLDGAQAVPHTAVDMQDLDCDFYTFSGHKLFGPTGIGILYGKEDILDSLPPYQGGGDMIKSVSFKKTTYSDLPSKFEAGTPNIAGAVGLATAIDYVKSIGYATFQPHEEALLHYATDELSAIDKVRIIGTSNSKTSVISFVMEGVHPHDVGTVLDQNGVAVRTGHHCTQPVMERFNVPATSRASFTLYNTKNEVDALIDGIHQVIEIFV